MANESKASRLASLEDELHKNCREFFALQSKMMMPAVASGSRKKNYMLSTLTRAVSEVLHAFGDSQMYDPSSISVIGAYANLVQHEASSIDDLEQVSVILCRLAAIANAIVEEHRLTAPDDKRSSRPPPHRRSGVRRLSGALPSARLSLPPAANGSIPPPSRRPSKRRR